MPGKTPNPDSTSIMVNALPKPESHPASAKLFYNFWLSNLIDMPISHRHWINVKCFQHAPSLDCLSHRSNPSSPSWGVAVPRPRWDYFVTRGCSRFETESHVWKHCHRAGRSSPCMDVAALQRCDGELAAGKLAAGYRIYWRQCLPLRHS